MTKKDARRLDEPRQEAAQAEQDLLDDESRAERRYRRAQERLVAAEDQLARVQARVERRQRDLQTTLIALRRSQEARAVGPELDDAGTATPEPTNEDAASGATPEKNTFAESS